MLVLSPVPLVVFLPLLSHEWTELVGDQVNYVPSYERGLNTDRKLGWAWIFL